MGIVRDLGSFLAMGGYAAFVWPAYGVTAAVLGGLVLYATRRYRVSLHALADLRQGVATRR